MAWNMFRTTFLYMMVFLAAASDASASVRLNVPLHRQEHSLSCEIATLKMALAAHNITVPENELIQKLPFDVTPKSPGVWGDPNRGFVGNIDGQMLVNGYGVYWDPIAAVGDQYADAIVMRHASSQDVTQQLTLGNPVIIWGYYGRRAVYNWNTPAGQPIKAVNGEHTRIVYGFDGPPDNPTYFYLNDPLYGHLRWSTAELMHNWSALNHMAVAVAPPTQWVRVPGQVDVWEIDAKTRTRRLITTWQAFQERGGANHRVDDISESDLLTYSRKEDIK